MLEPIGKAAVGLGVLGLAGNWLFARRAFGKKGGDHGGSGSDNES